MKPETGKTAEQANIEGVQELSSADLDQVVGGVTIDEPNTGGDPTSDDSATPDMRKSGGNSVNSGKVFLGFRFK